MKTRDSAGTREWAELKADVDLTKGRLLQLRTSAQRLVEDFDAILEHPPFASAKADPSTK